MVPIGYCCGWFTYPEAIDSYVKSKNPENFAQVIEIAEHAGKEEELITFLDMAREH